ncbi:MAG TPA: nitrile hydratase subunit beta [Roseiarcus sp.]|nr:nitrile hydratase subunit beta [Roseiarcus sp.]
MDGMHDLGGREGFGAIRNKDDGEPFHADWEARSFGIIQSSAGAKGWSIDWFRHCRELIEPVDYLSRPYFDQWMTTGAAQMIDEGYLTLDEIRDGASNFDPRPGRPAATVDESRASVANPRSFAMQVAAPPRFATGDFVRCALSGHTGHTRLPGYVRGRRGVVHARHGGHVFPDASARGERRGEHLYTIGFAAADLWPEAKSSRDRVFLDLWESYLEPA